VTAIISCVGIIRTKDIVGKGMTMATTTMMMMVVVVVMVMVMVVGVVIVMILQLSPAVFSTQQKSIPGTKGGIAFWLIRIMRNWRGKNVRMLNIHIFARKVGEKDVPKGVIKIQDGGFVTLRRFQ